MTTTPPPHPAAAAAAAAPPWHLARSLESLLGAVNAHWPGRDKRSDGGIGDARHQAEGAASDHNPWLSSWLGPAVRAYDFTVTQPAAGISGVDGAWLAEQLRLVGASGDDRLAGKSGDVNDNGYVIYNRQVTRPDFSGWVAYTGEDPHTAHVHVSVTREVGTSSNPAGFEDPRAWDFLGSGAHPNPTPDPTGLVQVAAVHPAPAGQPAAVSGPHEGNPAAEAPTPVTDVDGPEGAGYNPAGQDALGTGAAFRAQFGNQGPLVANMQIALNKDLALYAQLDVDGIYGAETCGVIEDFARRVASDPHCPDEHREALAGSNGDNVGPHLAAVFPLYGILV